MLRHFPHFTILICRYFCVYMSFRYIMNGVCMYVCMLVYVSLYGLMQMCAVWCMYLSFCYAVYVFDGYICMYIYF